MSKQKQQSNEQSRDELLTLSNNWFERAVKLEAEGPARKGLAAAALKKALDFEQAAQAR